MSPRDQLLSHGTAITPPFKNICQTENVLYIVIARFFTPPTESNWSILAGHPLHKSWVPLILKIFFQNDTAVAAPSLPLLMLPPKATSLLPTLPPYNFVAVTDSFVHFLILSPTVLLIVTMCNGSDNRVGIGSAGVTPWCIPYIIDWSSSSPPLD